VTSLGITSNAGDTAMTKQPCASILFYDEETGQLRLCNVLRAQVQTAMNSATTMAVPPHLPEHSTEPITDEDARQLGGMMILLQGYAHPELRERFHITTERPTSWTIEPPGRK
jgi:hypothetical protein